jgi:alkanesulfonate monooxygenase SsuD/methylene tetrahydromethanopterin reductase-like flavin-dependent oxidoreductase (luciferase family)
MVKAWEEKDRAKAAAEAPWDLIESTFLLGSPEQIRDRLDEYVAGGITLPVITPITTPDKMGPLISSLAP